MIECPICDGEIGFEDELFVGEILGCCDCGNQLEVVSLEPFVVEELPIEAEDWCE